MPEFRDFFYPSSTGKNQIHARMCVPDGTPKGVVQIAHGIAEYINRYDAFMEFLAKNGYVAVGNDHLGHGQTAARLDEQGIFAEEDGWYYVVEDMKSLRDHVREEYHDIPYVFFGHSMGSFLTRTFLIRYPELYDAAILSGTGHQSPALINAGRIMKETHCQAIKLEGGARVCPQIKEMVDAGIPVMAHIGLTPQSINVFGGNRVQGKTEDAAKELLEDAYKVQEAGAFSVTLECVPAPVASLITKKLDIPTIGIGGGNECDGQVLVYQDMLGMFKDFVPKFVRQFGNIGEEMVKAFQEYDAAVKDQSFPDAEHSFQMKNEEALQRLY